MILDPEVVFLDVGGVHNEEIMVSLKLLVHKKIVDSPPVRVKHHPVEDLPGGHRTDIICEHVVHKLLGIRSANENLAHVRDIEHPDFLADGQVFLRDR